MSKKRLVILGGGESGVGAAILGKKENYDSAALTTLYDGPRPNAKYKVMKKQGAIILGIGGDNSNGGVGTFYEGVMTAGCAPDAVDAAVHANIVALGYGT